MEVESGPGTESLGGLHIRDTTMRVIFLSLLSFLLVILPFHMYISIHKPSMACFVFGLDGVGTKHVSRQCMEGWQRRARGKGGVKREQGWP